jgi:hypothetical protein
MGVDTEVSDGAYGFHIHSSQSFRRSTWLCEQIKSQIRASL